MSPCTTCVKRDECLFLKIIKESAVAECTHYEKDDSDTE
jgi:hypothetical protein